MKRVRSSQRSRAHSVWIPMIDRIFKGQANDTELAYAAGVAGMAMPLPPEVRATVSASKRYSPAPTYAGNSDPDLFVDSGVETY